MQRNSANRVKLRLPVSGTFSNQLSPGPLHAISEQKHEVLVEEALPTYKVPNGSEPNVQEESPSDREAAPQQREQEEITTEECDKCRSSSSLPHNKIEQELVLLIRESMNRTQSIAQRQENFREVHDEIVRILAESCQKRAAALQKSEPPSIQAEKRPIDVDDL